MEQNKNYFIDTHCHLNLLVKKDFDIPLTEAQIHDAAPIIKQAENAHVKIIINIGTNIIESMNCIKLAQQYTNLFAVVGIYPTDLTEQWQNDFDEIKKLLKEKKQNKIVGIGEIGVDKYRPGYNLQRQIDGFRQQINLALETDLPIVVHTRTAPEETLTILQEFKNDLLRGIIHCYPYDKQWADEVIKLNFKLGIGGAITYPSNKTLPAIVKELSLDHIVLETDAPFLPPQPIRGQQNSPAQLPLTAQFIAELKHISLTEVAEKTTTNAIKLFRLSSYS